MIKIRIYKGDILNTPCDLLILKHADGFYGVDERVANLLDFHASVPDGQHVFVEGAGLKASQLLFLGVGPLVDFRYEKIRQFGKYALSLAADRSSDYSVICMTIHGPGYGLDENEAFLSLISGINDAINIGVYPKRLCEIQIIENNATRAKRLATTLNLYERHRNQKQQTDRRGEALNEDFGATSETKKRVFVAMPFADKFSDVWDISIQDACTAAGIVCERVDQAIFTGDILSEIKKRVEICDALIALLDDANPNVFLEIGYAWALKKPTVLLASSSEKLPFDVRGQRCLIYKSINDLRSKLTAELTNLNI